jgi:hypothetical protein
MSARSALAKHRYEWLIAERERRICEVRLAAEKAEAKRIAPAAAARQARIDGLLSDANALERAKRIRVYVSAVCGRTTIAGFGAQGIESWAEWALAIADRLGPLVEGRFLRQRPDETDGREAAD